MPAWSQGLRCTCTGRRFLHGANSLSWYSDSHPRSDELICCTAVGSWLLMLHLAGSYSSLMYSMTSWAWRSWWFYDHKRQSVSVTNVDMCWACWIYLALVHCESWFTARIGPGWINQPSSLTCVDPCLSKHLSQSHTALPGNHLTFLQSIKTHVCF